MRCVKKVKKSRKSGMKKPTEAKINDLKSSLSEFIVSTKRWQFYEWYARTVKKKKGFDAYVRPLSSAHALKNHNIKMAQRRRGHTFIDK